MKTKIILTRAQASAEVELSYDNPFEDVLFQFRGDMLLVKIYMYYLVRRGSTGYFMNLPEIDNIETHLNILPVLRMTHDISAQVHNPPALEDFVTEDDDPLAVY